MQYRYRNLRKAGWWVIPLGVLLLLCTPELLGAGVVSLRLLCAGGIMLVATTWYWRQGAHLLRHRDELSEEEAECRRRLQRLRRQVGDVEAATREVRSEFKRSSERSRVENVCATLDHRLREVQSAMARERAVQYSIEAARWQRRIEPLLRDFEWLEADFEAADAFLLEEWVQVRLDRVNGLRPIGMRLQAQLHSDFEAISLPAGVTLVALLHRELGELEKVRVDLLLLRADLIECNRPGEAAQPDPELLVHRLKSIQQRIRARDERTTPHEPSSTIMRRFRTQRSVGAPTPLVLGRQDPFQRPPAA